MAKPKTPLLSLEAHGTLADTLTYQGTGNRKIARAKPRLPYFLTLPVQYQRWLYEDYAYLWRQQTAATQKAYRAAGVRHHLTGFQYWMKYQLTNLPDIAALWHLDVNAQPTTPDSSRNENTGTIFGASPTTGLIDGCLSFDGINDWVACGTNPILRPLDNFTLEAFIYIRTILAQKIILSNANNAASNGYGFMQNFATIRFWINAWNLRFATGPILQDTWYHVIGTYDRSLPNNNINLYLNGALQTPFTYNLAPDYSAIVAFYLGRFGGAGALHHGYIDNTLLYTRLLDTTEIARHAARRYPPA